LKQREKMAERAHEQSGGRGDADVQAEACEAGCCTRQCCAGCRQHFCRRPTLKQLIAGLLFALAFVTIIILSSTGDLRRLCDELDALGWGAVAIFVFLFIFSGLPFGYGYTIILVSAGYVCGWRALIAAEIGQPSAVAIGVLTSRRCLRMSVQAKLDSLPEAWSRPLRLLSTDLSRSVKGFILIDVLLRSGGSPLPFGMYNCLVGSVTSVPIYLATFSGFLASQPGFFIHISIGHALAESMQQSNGTSTGDEDSGGGFARIALQIAITLAAGMVVGWWARRRLRALVQQHAGTRSPTAKQASVAPAAEPLEGSGCQSTSPGRTISSSSQSSETPVECANLEGDMAVQDLMDLTNANAA